MSRPSRKSRGGCCAITEVVSRSKSRGGCCESWQPHGSDLRAVQVERRRHPWRSSTAPSMAPRSSARGVVVHRLVVPARFADEPAEVRLTPIDGSRRQPTIDGGIPAPCVSAAAALADRLMHRPSQTSRHPSLGIVDHTMLVKPSRIVSEQSAPVAPRLLRRCSHMRRSIGRTHEPAARQGALTQHACSRCAKTRRLFSKESRS